MVRVIFRVEEAELHHFIEEFLPVIVTRVHLQKTDFRGGDALRIHNDGPDRYWFGNKPDLLADVRGEAATQAIRDIKKAVADYPWPGSYRTWPGPNSNSFTAFVTRRVPALKVNLPPTAIGKDYIGDTTIIGNAPSGSGAQLSLWGVAGVIISPE